MTKEPVAKASSRLSESNSKAALSKTAYLKGLLLLALLYAGSAQAQPRTRGPYDPGGKPFAVVEFFNSESCLHCRQATEQVRDLLDRAKQDKERIFVLTFHVDYLEEEEWEDPYESSEFSARQRAYNKELRQKLVLPGQVIINGSYPALAEHFNLVDEAILRFLGLRSKAELTTQVKLVPEVSQLKISFSVKGLRAIRRDHFLFHAALVEDGVVRKITAGPNAGYTFKHSNLVRQFATAKFGKEYRGDLELLLPEDLEKNRSALILFVQDPITLEIYAAEQLPLSSLKSSAKAASRGQAP